VLRTPVCDLLGIDVPLACAPFGPWREVELAAAVCEAGALGALGTGLRSPAELVGQWTELRARTGRPFAINHTVRPFDEAAFAASLEFGPAAISFHLDVPADLVARAHDAGVLWIQQVMDVEQARAAVAARADVIVAQGGEAGGHGGDVSTLVLVAEVLDVAGATPVLAAGGIADGRGLAAVLAMGAQGAVMGTRFLASEEMGVAPEWKAAIVAAQARDAVKVAGHERVLPPFNRPHAPTTPRALRTPLIDALREAPETVDPQEAGPAIVASVRAGGGHEHLPFAGQSCGLVHDVLPAAEIVRRTLAEAEAALGRYAD
jgi:enoyl-[acyl-carrier protein] reductase II